MDRFFICEGKIEKKSTKYNASSKARVDVESILKEMEYRPLFINSKYCGSESKKNKIIRIIEFINNYFIWNKALKNIKKDSIIIIQYPLINSTLGLGKLIKKYQNKFNICILIHDLNSIRLENIFTGAKYKRIYNEDISVIKNSNYIISHNKNMTKKIGQLVKNKKDIVNLELFDYLWKDKIENKFSIDKPIVIAGNLNSDKANYIEKINEVKNVKFNLYGNGYNENKNNKNIQYMGSFLPNEIIKKIDGSFGLVWDGNSITTCESKYGKYLKYNNPHKFSMYLAAELPIIIWKEAALADLVNENNIGFTINSLSDISNKIDNISEDEYKIMKLNTKNMAHKLHNGIFLKNAIENIESKINKKRKIYGE